MISKPKPAPKSDSGLTPLELVSANNLVVHHDNKRLKTQVYALAAVCLILFLSVLLLALKGKKERYFATNTLGQIYELKPMDQPMLTNAQVASFAVEATTETLSIDFTNYEKQLSRSQEYFHPDAFKIILDELRNSGYLKTVTSGKFVATAVATEAPLIQREGRKPSGIYAWEVTFPVSVKLSSVEGFKTQLFKATVVVERAPADIRPRSIAVTKMDLLAR